MKLSCNTEDVRFIHMDGGSLTTSQLPTEMIINLLSGGRVEIEFCYPDCYGIKNLLTFDRNGIKIYISKKFGVVAGVSFDVNQHYEEAKTALYFVINALVSYSDKVLLAKDSTQTVLILSARSLAVILYNKINEVEKVIVDMLQNHNIEKINKAADTLYNKLSQYDWLTSVSVGVDNNKLTIIVFAESLVDSIFEKIPTEWEGHPITARRMGKPRSILS